MYRQYVNKVVTLIIYNTQCSGLTQLLFHQGTEHTHGGGGRVGWGIGNVPGLNPPPYPLFLTVPM